MKLLVKRNQLKHFQKAKIEIEEVNEWTLLSGGLEALLKQNEENIKYWTDQIENPRDWVSEDDLKKYKKLLEKELNSTEKIKKLIETLDVKNETEWDGK